VAINSLDAFERSSGPEVNLKVNKIKGIPFRVQVL
jgi:hypothetical protein